MDRGNRRLQFGIAVAVSLAAATVGVSFTWDSVALPEISSYDSGFEINYVMRSWLVYVSSIGFVVGSFVAGYITDRCGRRISILASSVPIVIGVILKICAWKVWVLCTARILFGLGTGIIMTASIVYLAEIADKDIRGMILLSNQFMKTFGGLLILTVGYFVSYTTLKYLLILCPLIYFFACWWIPESPYYLLKANKVDDGKKSLQILSGITDENVLEEKLSEIQSQVKIDVSSSNSFKELITGKRCRRAAIIVFVMDIIQFRSVMHVIPFCMQFFRAYEIHFNTAFIALEALKTVLGILSALLVDRLGRRPLIIFTSIGTGISLVIVAVYYGVSIYTPLEYPYTLIPLVGTISAMTISILGYESLSNTIAAELFPLNVKALAIAMSFLTDNVAGLLWFRLYQLIRDISGLCGQSSLLAIVAIISAVFVYFMIPETKGKTLKEIQVELQGDLYKEDNEILNKVVVDGKETAATDTSGKDLSSQTEQNNYELTEQKLEDLVEGDKN